MATDNSGNDASTSAKESEKAATPTATTATNTSAETDEPPSSQDQQQHREHSYICDCRVCYCGAAVSYPGDFCSVCIKHY